MIIRRQNPLGGPKLKEGNFPLREDPKTHDFGLLVGYAGKCDYCGKGGGEPFLIKLADANHVANMFGDQLKGYRKFFKQMNPMESMRIRIVRWALGRKSFNRTLEQIEVEDKI